MSNSFYNVFGISLLLTLSHQVPQIFHEISTCKVSVETPHGTEEYVVPSYIIAQNGDLRVNVTLCNENIYLPGDQFTFSTVHLYNKTSKLSLYDSSAPKPYQATHTVDGILINLQNEIKCTEDENYSFFIQMGKFNSKIPRVNLEDDCVIGIEMASPDYHPPCMQHVSGKWFIDMSPLRRKPPITINHEGKTFKISVCGPIQECSQQAGCQMEGNERTIFGTLENLKVKFDDSSNMLTVFSKTNKPKKTMTLTVKCNWNVPKFSRAKLPNPKVSNDITNYKFEVQSSYGCVKMPKSCVLTEENKHLTFDLRGLTPSSGSAVSNTARDIRLSICDDLKLTGSGKNNCHSEKSQVCEIRNGYINRGSIPHFQVHENGIEASFRDGHECNENETFATTIDFRCSFVDTGPVFRSEEGCLTKLSWETPRACPKLEIKQKSCVLSSFYGRLNLTELYSSEDYVTQISANQRLVYNICGRLKTNCSKSDGVSACLMDGNQEKIVGWNEPTLSFINGKIQLKYSGEKCGRQLKPYTFTINLICSFGTIDSRVTKVDECTFEAWISTTSACLKSWEIKSCIFEAENYRYDLSPLIRRDESYQIKDGRNNDITYYLNLCAPVIPKENLLFFPNNMVYMSNSSIPSILHKFTSLGGISNPEVRDGKLVVEAKGDACGDGDKVHTSTIFFECSTEEGSPTVLKTEECNVDFLWRTKFACLTMKKGGTCSFIAGNSSVQVPGDPMEVKIDNENTYQFSLCLDQYRWCRRDGSCLTGGLSRNARIQNGVVYVQYTLDQSVGSPLRTVSVAVECDPYKRQDFSNGYRRGDHFDINVKTRMSCQNGNKATRDADKPESKTEADTLQEENKSEPLSPEPEEQTVPEVKKVDQSHEVDVGEKPTPKKNESFNSTWKKVEIEYKPSTPVENLDNQTVELTKVHEKTEVVQSVANPCDILRVKGRTINLTDLESEEFKVGQDIFIVNFDGSSSKCRGRICKNGGNLLDFIEKCPDVSYEDQRVVLNYLTAGHCVSNGSGSSDGRVVEVSLGCNKDKTVVEGSEANCKVTISYNSPKICVSSNSSSSFITIVVVIILLVSFVICLIIFILNKKNYFKKCSYDRVSEDCLVVHSKML
ncbi:uncharacterized protein LOC123320693 [Coccinella septempunctata]|uniref:uncharacterized protein LOC123320693 n=1 Tax=Coccinella septempunctata TaxID=41139 RepID=UPI001D088102|nr:uncharacterized protein LOC123320693 [Coccinella septempunctata]